MLLTAAGMGGDDTGTSTISTWNCGIGDTLPVPLPPPKHAQACPSPLIHTLSSTSSIAASLYQPRLCGPFLFIYFEKTGWRTLLLRFPNNLKKKKKCLAFSQTCSCSPVAHVGTLTYPCIIYPSFFNVFPGLEEACGPPRYNNLFSWSSWLHWYRWCPTL